MLTASGTNEVFAVSEGDSIVVEWPGFWVNCVQQELGGRFAYGNLSYVEGSGYDSGEPFCILTDGAGEYTVYCSQNDVAQVDLRAVVTELKQIDYLNWRYALKSNYVKGAHTLRSILADPAQAKMFAENPAAVAVALSYDTENLDRNAVELHNLLSKSGVAEAASNTYLCNTYGVTSFGELFEDEELMAAALEDSATMNAIVSSESAMESIATNSKAMESVTKSATAMASVAASEVAMETIIYTPSALSALTASEAVGILLADDTATSHLFGNSAASDALATSEYAMEAIAGSAKHLNAMCKVSTARTSWMNSSYAHTFYDLAYETLHNASDDLFLKYEDHYTSPMGDVDIANATGNGGDYPYYTNASGGWSSSTSSSKTHNNAKPLAGITLAHKGTSDATNMVAYFGSSQTKKNLANITAYDEYLDVRKVCVGGLSLYSSYTYPGLSVGASFATYTAV